GRHGSEPATGLTTLTSEKAILKSTRDKEAKAAAKAAKDAAAAAPAAAAANVVSQAAPAAAPAAPPASGPVAPSKSGKPKTDAPETS
ncbi:MAG: MucR family transcriptional regulator, partial [Mesorhizobium sp.]